MGIVAYWNKDSDDVESEFLPFPVPANRVKVAQYSLPYCFGVLQGVDVHPYKYSEKNSSTIELTEYINDKWMKTGEYNIESRTISTSCTTPMTTAVLTDLSFVLNLCDIVNKAEQKESN